MNYKIIPIPSEQTKDWLLYKHYAHRVPPIMFAFGLYNERKELQGICTFGMPCVQMNDGKCIFENEFRVRTLELNRLVINEGLEKNVLSFFLGQCLKLLPKPLCLVSFADPNNGHNGYIYQATNWLYAGLSEKGGKNKDYLFNDRNYHGKTITIQWFRDNGFNYDSTKTLPENFELIGGEVRDFGLKHRYLMFLGNRKQTKEMRENLGYQILPYPKGENKRYDASYKPKINGVLF